MIKLFCNHDYELIKQHIEPSTLMQLKSAGFTNVSRVRLFPSVVFSIYKCSKCKKIKESKVEMD